MNDGILISVIVPVYNGEKTIRRAVESVLCQMDGRIELILVDDGSKDESGAICDEFAATYDNIRVVHKKNGGLSSARNAGINVANGSYVMFLDADDYFEETVCKEVCDVIVQCTPDCIDFGWQYVSNGIPLPPEFHKLPKNTLLGANEIKEIILPPLLNLCKEKDYFIFDFVWNKVFQRNMLQTYGVTFDESRRIWEDRPFVVHYLRYCNNYYAMDRCFYNYVNVPGSLSRRYSLETFRTIIANYKQYRELYGNEYDFDVDYVNNYWCNAIENMVFHSLEQTENTEQIRKNILETLVDPQVVHWYANRNPENEFEHKVSELIVSGNVQEAVRCYEKQVSKKRMKHAYQNVKSCIRRVVRKIIRR